MKIRSLAGSHRPCVTAFVEHHLILKTGSVAFFFAMFADVVLVDSEKVICYDLQGKSRKSSVTVAHRCHELLYSVQRKTS